jgi:hypothetical protein
MLKQLLPANATSWEEALASTIDTIVSVEGSINAIRGTKLVNPPAAWLPFLVYEYGLDELRPYVPNLYELIEQGIDWQRVRGTHAAVQKGLGFIGYTASIEEALARRHFWNSFQLRFPTLPPVDYPDLDRIDGIATLSVPKRSVFRRGVHYYDVGPLVGDGGAKLDGSRLEAESGVRLRENGPLWSFGRPTEIVNLLTEEDGSAIDNWLEPVVGGLTWEDMGYPWTDATFPWTADGVDARAALLAAWFQANPGYVCLRDTDGLIGYRRLRAQWTVEDDTAGVYKVANIKYQPTPSGRRAYLAALTGFGDGAGRTATSVSLAFNLVTADDVPPGRLWLEEDDVVSADEIATTNVSIPLRPTVREDIKFILRF